MMSGFTETSHDTSDKIPNIESSIQLNLYSENVAGHPEYDLTTSSSSTSSRRTSSSTSEFSRHDTTSTCTPLPTVTKVEQTQKTGGNSVKKYVKRQNSAEPSYSTDRQHGVVSRQTSLQHNISDKRTATQHSGSVRNQQSNDGSHRSRSTAEDNTHKRSASHVGFMFSAAQPEYGTDPQQVSVAFTEGQQVSQQKEHHRSQSQGQMSESLKTHRREGSRAEFILPEGHEERERVRELNPSKSFAKKGSVTRRGHTREASRTESVYTIREQKKTWLEKILFWKKIGNESSTRLVVPNPMIPKDVSCSDHPNFSYAGNEICTTKYTVLSFLPKNLYEQFHRFANLYFLFIVLLNFVPAVNAFAKELAMVPLLFVLSVTAIKDAYEDRRRYSSDKRVNGSCCRVFSRSQGCYVCRTWKDVCVGDIIYIASDEVIPADVVLLNTSDEHGVCYIESSNLDGETNLKQRQSVSGIKTGGKFDASKFDFVLEVGPPTTKIYHFVGTIPVRTGAHIPLSKDNLILRDCVVKNTDFVEGIVVYAGRDTKALLNNGGTRYKRSKLERQMNNEVIWCVAILILICLFSATGAGLWQRGLRMTATLPETQKKLEQSAIITEPSLGNLIFFLPPASMKNLLSADYADLSPLWIAFTSFWTFIILYQVLIPISLYVTIEIIKLVQVYHIHVDKDLEDQETGGKIVCRALNITEELGQVEYMFTDKTGTLTENKMVFQRCSINGKDFGHESTASHLDKNFRESFLINSELEEDLQSVEFQNIYRRSSINKHNDSMDSCSMSQNEDCQRLSDFFFTLAACNTVIVAKPKSSQINIHISQPPYSRNISFQPNENDSYSNTASLTGTETTIASEGTSLKSGNFLSNFMSLSRSKTNKVDVSLSSVEGNSTLSSSSSKLARTGQPESLEPYPVEYKPKFEAESPDELALVDAAYKYGFRLLRRNIHGVAVEIPGCGINEYEVLHVLPFDSNRKRMSVIIRDPDTKEIILYCKGADSAVLENLSIYASEAELQRIEDTQRHLNSYSKTGLRVLCMAKRILTENEYSSWLLLHQQAENSLANREEKLYASFCKIERNMQLLGATGIEDRLQEGVPQTIKALRKAGIVVWVLTGDKQETAINIAYSCSLFSPHMEILKLSACTKDQTERTIHCYLRQIEEEDNRHNNFLIGTTSASSHHHHQTTASEPKERGLVVDGRTLVFILDKRANLKMIFLSLASRCNAVMCCRATPLQKALIVRNVKHKLNVLTIAVGDGANDVSMIQTADVGIGISGVEGRQAVMSSDFAISRFRHLEKLILVHGHWCYERLARIILYFFYKNVCFVFLLMWYQLYCGYSASVMIDELYLVMFNLLFTSLPPMTVGAYDQDASADMLLSQPKLYAKTRLGTVYTKHSFWLNIADAVYQSVALFFVTSLIYDHSDSGIYEFGMTITHACVLTQLLHISIETKSWTVIQLSGILLSYLVYILFGVFYTIGCNGCLGLPSQYGELVHMFTTPKHWFSVLIACTLALLPRFVYRSAEASLWPDEITKATLANRNINKRKFVGTLSLASSVSSIYRRGEESA